MAVSELPDNLRALPVRPAERYVSRDELAGMMGVSVDTIDRWRKQNMPSVVFGRRTRRFLPSQAMAWAREWKGEAA